MAAPGSLAARLGMSTHVSLLKRKLMRLCVSYPSCADPAPRLEEWLVDMANARGATVMTRNQALTWPAGCPGLDALTDEELVIGLCGIDRLDRPPMLRVAAQLISRGRLDAVRLLLLARRERADVILAELARQALRVQPDHELWKHISDELVTARRFREPLLHWTRLAEPLPWRPGTPKGRWRLVA